MHRVVELTVRPMPVGPEQARAEEHWWYALDRLIYFSGLHLLTLQICYCFQCQQRDHDEILNGNPPNESTL
jgi:hypothetical protein